MRKVLLASHGCVASGVRSAIEILLGDAAAITAVDCYLDDGDFVPAIRGWIDAISAGDEGVIFTDLVGGSVCNKVMELRPEERGIVHVAGFNLITVIECLICDVPLTPKRVDEIVAAGSQQMRRVAAEPENAPDSGGNEDDFFA